MRVGGMDVWRRYVRYVHVEVVRPDVFGAGPHEQQHHEHPACSQLCTSCTPATRAPEPAHSTAQHACGVDSSGQKSRLSACEQKLIAILGMQPGRCNDGRCCGRDDGVLSHGSGCVRTALCTMPSTPSRGGYARQAVKTTRRYASRAHTVWWLAGMAARILSRCCYLFGDIKKSGGLHRCCGDAGRLDANLQRRRRISYDCCLQKEQTLQSNALLQAPSYTSYCFRHRTFANKSFG